MGFNQRGHQLNVALTVIQTGDIVERFATTVQKDFLVLLSNFFQRF
ncbi:Uncharacterised protein [Vibrio cholerae]|uniref:Uncharacterized protein n=1 Tax=Vibrio cholerae TaxID=666 RepID=A0A655QC84_VIBCL|nr:Uncharacterised protein [Vibrio cholerae]CSA52983.1 Uncharacterised protein [Vibrio cholerae]CSA73815.1 Uncharacterised protein [Vibrio cholerae]